MVIPDVYVPAVFGIGGVVLGALLKDVFMGLLLLRKKHENESSVRHREQQQREQTTLWHYASPQLRAIESLRYRLREIIKKKHVPYLLSSAPQSHFFVYKYISTLYRVAAVLGWLRAFRKERSYLSAASETLTGEWDTIFGRFEHILADGHDLEVLRFQKLCDLWQMPLAALLANHPRGTEQKIASGLDAIIDRHLISGGQAKVGSLTHHQKLALCNSVANYVSSKLGVIIPKGVIKSQQGIAVEYFDIDEYYIYRDWQTAIGDMMIVAINNTSRRFDVIGFGEFEQQYITAKGLGAGSGVNWINRLEGIVLDLDMTNAAIFNERRKQLIYLYKEVFKIERKLKSKLKDHLRQMGIS